MAMGAIFAFTAEVRAALPLIRSAVAEGYDALNTRMLLQEAGISVNARQFNSLFAGLSAERGAAQYLGSLRQEYRFNPFRLPEAVTRLRRQFSFTVRLLFEDGDTGDLFEKIVTVATDRIMTRNEIEAAAMDSEEKAGYGRGGELVNAQILEGKRSGELGTL